MQAELQTALFHAFDTLNLQQMKSFNVPPVTLHGVGALAACGPQAQSRGLRHLFVMVDSFLHQAGMTAGLERSLAMKGIAMTLWPCPAGEPCVTDVCAAVAQLRDARCDGVVAFGGGSVLDAAKAVALLVANPEQTLGEMTEHSELRPRLPLIAVPTTAGGFKCRWKRVKTSLSISSSVIPAVARITDRKRIRRCETTIKVNGKRIST